MKKYTMSVLAMFAIVFFISVPTQASSFDDGLVGISAQQTPPFMQDLEFNFKTEAEMAEVRGENLGLFGEAIVLLISRSIIHGTVALNLVRNWLYTKSKDPSAGRIGPDGRTILINTINGLVPFEYVTTPAVIR